MNDFDYLLNAKAESLGVKAETIKQTLARMVVAGDIDFEDEPTSILLALKKEDLH
ncbi:hypothetical protein AB4143_05175 [Vibrio breoganii]